MTYDLPLVYVFYFRLEKMIHWPNLRKIPKDRVGSHPPVTAEATSDLCAKWDAAWVIPGEVLLMADPVPWRNIGLLGRSFFETFLF